MQAHDESITETDCINACINTLKARRTTLVMASLFGRRIKFNINEENAHLMRWLGRLYLIRTSPLKTQNATTEHDNETT